VASTAEVSRQVDAIQYETREGPCLEAIDGHDVARVADLTTDTQWPSFARRCVAETGVHCMFSLRLFAGVRAAGRRQPAAELEAARHRG
jgi:hypothetical protein